MGRLLRDSGPQAHRHDYPTSTKGLRLGAFWRCECGQLFVLRDSPWDGLYWADKATVKDKNEAARLEALAASGPRTELTEDAVDRILADHQPVNAPRHPWRDAECTCTPGKVWSDHGAHQAAMLHAAVTR